MNTSSQVQKIRKKDTLTSFYGVGLLLIIAVVIWTIFKILTPSNFGSVDNLYYYLQSSIIYSVGACGLYFIIVMGLFDFSIGANIILSGIVGAVLSKHFGYAGLVLGCMLCGTLIGFLNGVIYIKLKIPSMIVTVGLMLIYESIASFVGQGSEQSLDKSLQWFGYAPGNIILAALAFVIAQIFLKYTKIGTYCYAIGSNEMSTKNMGINVNIYKLRGFVLMHFLIGIMAILVVSYGSSIRAITGMASMDYNFTPMMGCFFGMAFKKFNIPILAIIIGEFIISLLFNGFIALGAPTTIQNVITGLVLLVVVALTIKHTKGAVIK